MTPQSSTNTLRPTGEVPNGEVPVYCDCCPNRPKKMAVVQPDAIQIISRRSGKKHIARIPLHTSHSPHNTPTVSVRPEQRYAPRVL